MWKLLQESPTPYIIKINKETGYEIFITDFVCLWHVYFSESTFILQLKESNEGIEFENDSELVESGNKILSQPETLKKVNISTENDKNSLSIFLTMSCGGFPFKFKCKLARASDEMVFQTVTQQLLKIINDLWCSETTLRTILMQKDKELTAYKDKFGEIQHVHKKTKPFSDENHMHKHNLYETHFGQTSIPASVLQKTVEIPERNIKKEPTEDIETDIKIKQEILTPTIEAVNSTEVSIKQENIIKLPVHQQVCVKRRKKGLNF